MVSSHGGYAFGVHVSDAQKDRALRLLDGILTAFLTAGVTVAAGKSDDATVHLNVVGQFVSFRIDEQMDRSLREPTGKEVAEQQRYSWKKPDFRVYTPSGRLKLTVVGDNAYRPYLTISDGVHSTIDDRCAYLVERVWIKAAARNVEAQMREEQRQQWIAAEQRRQRIEAARRDVMERVEHVEKLIQKWQRAALLRQFADALEAIDCTVPHRDGVMEPAWLREAADWLDPLVAKRWPEADGDELGEEQDPG